MQDSSNFKISACGIASGILLVLSLPKPDLYPLAWIALIPWLYIVASGPDLRRTVTCAYAAGLVFFGGTFYWISETMAIYGDYPSRWRSAWARYS